MSNTRRARPVKSVGKVLTAAARRVSPRKMKRAHSGLDWNQEAWCVDSETEILSQRGWLNHAEVVPGDLVYTLDHATGTAAWEAVLDVASFDLVNAPMLSMEMKGHSSLTTMAHRWPVLRTGYAPPSERVPGKSNRLPRSRQWATSETLYAEDQLITAAPARDLPTEAKHSDAFVELVAWFWTEGSIRTSRTNPSIRIGQSVAVNPTYCARIESALTAVYGVPVDASHPGRVVAAPGWRISRDGDSETTGTTGVRIFSLNVAASAPLLAAAPGRVVSWDFLRELTLSQLLLFLDVSIQADGHIQRVTPVLTQKSRPMLESYLFACTLAGKTPHIWRDGTTNRWNSSRSDRATVSPRSSRTRAVVPYTGLVWCPVTPSSTWMARRNGTVWFTGNTHFDNCGELHYLATTVANAMSMVELFIAKRDANGGWERIEDDNDPAVIALDALAGDSPTGMSELIRRFGLNLFIAGDSWLIGHPHELDDQDGPPEPRYIDPTIPPEPRGPDLGTLCWKIYSAAEVKADAGKVKIGGREYVEDDVVMIRVWRPHPVNMNFADSPVRASLHLLRELEGLTKYVSAILDSRFVGAGIVWMPEGALAQVGSAPEDEQDGDTFMDMVSKVASIAIKERDSAESMVPIFASLPDDIPWRPEHMSWASPLDATAKELRDEAIRRLALSLDAPAEVLLGMGTTSHWSAWAIQDDYTKTHILPTIAILRDALVREYLRPILEANGILNAQDYTIEADASALTLRPNRASEALSLYDKDLITAASAREAMGFGEEDAPEIEAGIDEAVTRALDMVTQAPSLLQSFTLPDLVAQIREVMGGPKAPEPTPVEPIVEEPAVAEEVEPGPPQTEQPGEEAA